jgi:hypothetical protein
MHPSISNKDIKQTPFPRDRDTLMDLYGLSGGSSQALTAENIALESNLEEDDDAPLVRGIMYLTRDGECIHSVDGKITHRHAAVIY